MNKVILVGRLTADPELRQTPSGVSSCRFTVAVDRKFVDKTSGERQADFITCVAWRSQAEFVSRYFNKGRMIGIEGNIRTGSYKDRNNPEITRYTTEVFVDSVEFVGSKSESAPRSNNTPAQDPDFNPYSQIPPMKAAPQQPAQNDSMSYGNLDEFEEILNDGDVPF